MKVIIAGSRSITDYELVKQSVLDSGFEITEVVSGTAKGVDSLGEQYAAENRIPLKRVPADWERYGRAGGPKRNKLMAQYAEGIVLIWDGKSRGSANMRQEATRNGLKVFEKLV
jgi:predicted Rossmann fold nucleotide-binding protein DprA/Smf involved in DNA uptake